MPGAEDELTVRARARVGSVLKSKYRLDRVLGVGGMASVYAATHLRNANRVAVKVLHRELTVDAGLRERFLREGYAANTVEHGGTVRVLDDDVAEDGAPFIVMDLLDGETLDARWERSGRRLPFSEVVPLLRELLDVLVSAHAKGIVHRDLKPENLFITREGKLKVLDFGVARLREGSVTRTRSGSVFGTPAFMPPEQALGRAREVDEVSDVWAVGATAFALLGGRYVHSGETAEEMLVRAATQPAPPLARVAPSVPAPLAAVIDRALAFDKADRWQSAAAMNAALAMAVDESLRSPVGAANEVEKTRVTGAPVMTGTLPMKADAPDTVALPTLPVASTVGGVVSKSEARRARTRRLGLMGAGAAGVLVAVAVSVALGIAFESSRQAPSTTSTATVVQDLRPVAASAGASAPAVEATPPPSATVPTVAVDSLPRAPATDTTIAPVASAAPPPNTSAAAPPTSDIASNPYRPTAQPPPPQPPAPPATASPRPMPPKPKHDPLAP